MRKSIIAPLLVMLTVFVSCDKDEVMDPTKLPAKVQDYIAAHFSEAHISRVERDKGDSNSYYEVYLSTGYELDFNKAGDVYSIDGNTERLPDSVVPEKLSTYVSANYKSFFVVKWELDRLEQEIRLNNGVELVFDLNGEFKNVDK
ncbi:Protein of uncharacterised function (DUF2874) [Sphingobacterium spiritivorum]|uniref:Protein of uncharacterized function (DUF2874) n=1 Tax=Sphingobacterium spiritivorum TaxID=258 RepID=A0A380BS73_SPHSI|nr:PepSY-like domain-containing protein [Sphingobacterium spiritivorum]SUJ06265.1 Protein of uncharacterised function (DUF2874) [Sphingobacterium spiritivorum]